MADAFDAVCGVRTVDRWIAGGLPEGTTGETQMGAWVLRKKDMYSRCAGFSLAIERHEETYSGSLS